MTGSSNLTLLKEKRARGSGRKTIVRETVKDLLKAWGRQQGLIFLAEYTLNTAAKSNIAVDGAVLHELRMHSHALRFTKTSDKGPVGVRR